MAIIAMMIDGKISRGMSRSPQESNQVLTNDFAFDY